MKDPRERLIELLADCYDDPDLFNTAILGRAPFWEAQRRIAQSVIDYRTTVVYTGNMIGKDFCVASLIPWWLCTRSRSLIITTGPSQTSLGTITWKELRNACDNSKVPLGMFISSGAKTSPLICAVDGRSGWQALGYSTNNVERASGQHNAKLFVVVGEASGVEDTAWDGIESLGYDRLLVIGNPIRADGRFVDLIRQADADRRDGILPRLATNAIRIASTESPHAHLDRSPVGLADRTWLESTYRRYGKDSLWTRSHVFAEIPRVNADTLIPEAWLDWAAQQQRSRVSHEHPIHLTRRISVDLGEGVGRDSSSILIRDDWGVIDCVFGAYLGLAEAADRVRIFMNRYHVVQERISFDKVGVGKDFPLHLARLGITRAVGYAGAASPLSSDFANLRSEAAWKLRQRLDPDGAADHRIPGASRPFFCIPPGPYWHRLREELKTLTYSLKGNKTALIDKEDHAIVLGHSPDLSDSLCQSFAFA